MLDASDVRNAAEFIRACLHLDPEQRPSAAALMAHQWVSGAYMLVDYRPVPEQFKHLAQKAPRIAKYSYKDSSNGYM